MYEKNVEKIDSFDCNVDEEENMKVITILEAITFYGDLLRRYEEKIYQLFLLNMSKFC